MHDRDSLHRFIFEHYPIRGHLVHLDASWRALIEHRDYPGVIREALGETVVASLLLAATIKFQGVLSLQLQGPGAVQLLLPQCTSGLGVRGLARCREDLEADVSSRGLQRLPGERGAAAPATTVADPAAIDDAWRRVQLIGATLTPDELRSLADVEIVHRLFNEDDVRIFEPAPVYFRCRCSRDRVSGMLQGLGGAETRSILAERGEVEVRCDFCNRAYVFDAVDVGQLFNKGVASDASSSVH